MKCQVLSTYHVRCYKEPTQVPWNETRHLLLLHRTRGPQSVLTTSLQHLLWKFLILFSPLNESLMDVGKLSSFQKQTHVKMQVIKPAHLGLRQYNGYIKLERYLEEDFSLLQVLLYE